MLQALIGVDPDMVYQHVVEWIGQLTAVPVIPSSGESTARCELVLVLQCVCVCVCGVLYGRCIISI